MDRMENGESGENEGRRERGRTEGGRTYTE